MKNNILNLLIIVTLLSSPLLSANENGVISLKAAQSVNVVADQLVSIFKKKGLTIFARVDHAQGAKKAGLNLAPSQLVIFGTAKMGTPIMRCQSTVGLDLPLKVLIWEDKSKQTWITYNEPKFIANRHGLNDCGAKVISKMTNALAKMTAVAAGTK